MTETTDETRRYSIIATRPHYAHLSEELLRQTLRDASSVFTEYVHCPDPGAVADTLIVDIASIRLNMMGAEGSTSASEGDISRSWEELPPAIRTRLNSYRRPLYL
jgi:hypothetical protein